MVSHSPVVDHKIFDEVLASTVTGMHVEEAGACVTFPKPNKPQTLTG
jgi:hypothetical protein